MGRNFIEIFLWDLNANTKDVEYTITCGAFMSLRWEYSSKILEKITKTNWGWHPQEDGRSSGNSTIGASSDKGEFDEIVAQDVAQLRIEINLLAKQFTAVRVEKGKCSGFKK